MGVVTDRQGLGIESWYPVEVCGDFDGVGCEGG